MVLGEFAGKTVKQDASHAGAQFVVKQFMNGTKMNNN